MFFRMFRHIQIEESPSYSINEIIQSSWNDHDLLTRFSASTFFSLVAFPLLPSTLAVALVRILFSGSCISLNLLKSTLGRWMTLIFLTFTFLTGQMGEISLVIFFSMTSEVKRLRIWVALDLAISLATMSLILFLMSFCWEERAQLVLRFWLGDSRVKAITKTLNTYPSCDLTSWMASMRVFLFLMRELSSSLVISTPQKEVMACLPSVWSTMSLIFLQWKLSWLGAKSACMELTTLPLMLSSTFSMIIMRYTESLCPVGAGESKGFRLERCGCLELEPLFSGERVDHFLLLSLLAVAFFTFALSH